MRTRNRLLTVTTITGGLLIVVSGCASTAAPGPTSTTATPSISGSATSLPASPSGPTPTGSPTSAPLTARQACTEALNIVLGYEGVTWPADTAQEVAGRLNDVIQRSDATGAQIVKPMQEASQNVATTNGSKAANRALTQTIQQLQATCQHLS